MTDRRRACVVRSGLLTPYGTGVDACWEGLMSGKTAIGSLDRFPARALQSGVAGLVPGLKYLEGESLVAQMLGRLFEGEKGEIPADARLILATVKGEIDLLERDLLAEAAGAAAGTGSAGPGSGSDLNVLLSRVRETAGVTDPGIVVSAACASSTVALGRAAYLVSSGKADCVLVVACDAVTEFVYSGFSSLMALDPGPARPFDRARAGLSVGEAAGFALLMSGSRAAREGRAIAGEIAGWGGSCDANHMTGPSRDGAGQATALRRALTRAFATPAEIAAISAHGTGTLYNDSMEMQGFRSVFGADPKPVYSVKGGLGHTMGAAGLLEALIVIRAMNEGLVPPTHNLVSVDPEAEGWASGSARKFGRGRMVMSTNSGFGGVNAALVFRPVGNVA